MSLVYFQGSLTKVWSTLDESNLWNEGSYQFRVGVDNYSGKDIQYTLRLELKTPEYAFNYFGIKLTLFLAENSFMHPSSRLRYAICSAPTDDLYVHAHGAISDDKQIVSDMVTVANVVSKNISDGAGGDVPIQRVETTFDVYCSSEVALLPNTTYYVYLWDLESPQVIDFDNNGNAIEEMRPDSQIVEGKVISDEGTAFIYRHEVNAGADAGFVFIEGTSDFSQYKIYIDNGETYKQYIAYRDTGTDWIMCS